MGVLTDLRMYSEIGSLQDHFGKPHASTDMHGTFTVLVGVWGRCARDGE